jgi:hypothetical protein
LAVESVLAVEAVKSMPEVIEPDEAPRQSIEDDEAVAEAATGNDREAIAQDGMVVMGDNPALVVHGPRQHGR